jgi:hypothetical protein
MRLSASLPGLLFTLALFGATGACSSTDFGSAGSSKDSAKEKADKADPEDDETLAPDQAKPEEDPEIDQANAGQDEDDPIKEDGEVCRKPDATNFEEEIKGIYPSLMDAASQDAGETSGKPPLQVFVGKQLVAGKKILLVSATGRAVFRVYHGQIESETDCGHGSWRLDFRDAGNKILQVAVSSIFDAQNQQFLIPDGAASAWIGYKDAPGTYYDNEGGERSIDAGPTIGCTFQFKILPPECG